MITFI